MTEAARWFPQLRHVDEPADCRLRQQRVVAEIDRPSGHRTKQQLVEEVPEAEPQRLRPFRALGKHDMSGMLSGDRQQGANLDGAIFTVTIHDDRGVNLLAVENFAEPDRNGSLMAEVEGQVDDFDLGNARIGR